tara:strand:+ start:798 stop:1097 length:300 start_codon:yes stop_codon:yes gene_type:complete
MKNENPALLAAAVDRLATIKAQIADLKAEEDQVKAQLIEAGQAAIEGTQHRAAVSYCPGKDTTDWHAVADHFTPSRQLITAHTSTGGAFYTVRVSARKA